MANCTTKVAKNKSHSNHWSDGIHDAYDKITDYTGGQARSIVLTMIEALQIKPNSPFSTALLKHYLKRSGTQLNLADVAEIPIEWKDFIVKTTKGQMGSHNITPYNSGIFDLRNSLGHFDVKVTMAPNNGTHYAISDYYAFGFFKNDSAKKGRHGFPLGNIQKDQISLLRALLPDENYCNPGGFYESWEVRETGSETILYIPQAYLANVGKSYYVVGSFIQ